MNKRKYTLTFDNKSYILLYIFVTLLASLAVSLILTSKASAGPYYPKQAGDGATQNAIASKTGNWYPGQYTSGPNQGKWYNDSNDAYNCAWGSHWNANGSIPDQDAGACSTGLPAGKTRYKLFQAASGGGPQGTTVYINGACKGDTANGTTPYKKPDNPNKGDRRIKVTVRPTQANGSESGAEKFSTNNYNQGDCVGDDLRVNVPGGANGAFTLNQQGRYGSGVYTALLIIEKLDPKGQQMFRLYYPGGEVFGDEDASFALGNRRKGGFSNYEFIFKTDCSYSQSADYSFNIYDIDYGELQRPNNPIRIILVPIPFASTPENIIGELVPSTGQYKLPPGTLKPNTSYRLNFSSIEDNNGIRFDLPFSEYPSPGNCPPPDTPTPTTACDLLTFNMGLPPSSAGNNIPGTSVNPDRRHFAVYVNDGSSPGVPGAISNPSGSGNTVQPSANSPNTYNTGTYNWVPPLKGQYDYFSRDYFSDGIEENRNIRINLKNGRIGVLDGDNEVSHRDTNRPALKSGSLEYTIVIFNIYKKPNNPAQGQDRINIWYRQTFNAGNNPALANCYQASCSVDIAENVPGASNGSNAVRANSQFAAIMRVHNNSSHRLPIRLDTAPLGLSSGSGSSWDIGTSYNNPVWYGLPQDWMINGIPPGQSATSTVYLSAQGTVGTQWLNPYPDYYGRLLVGSSCNTPVNVYKQYEARIVPEVTLNPTDEDPSEAIFKSTISLKQDPGVSFNIHHNMVSTSIKNGVVAVLDTKNGSVTVPGEVTYIRNPQPTVGGDNFCVDVYSNQGKGWVGPGGTILGAERIPPTGTLRDCSLVHDRPYLSVYGSDAIAGSNFKNGKICNPTGTLSAIRTFRSPIGGKSGSGAQFAAVALGQISGFTSARLYNPPKGLSFANTETVSGMFSSEQPDDGGHFADPHLCATDFWNGQKQPEQIAGNPSNYSIQSLADVKESIINANTTTGVRLSGTGYNKNATLYVNGDVILTNNIAYNLGKNFKLIVRGNIYIDKSVSRLDGLYVAQPNESGQGGNIYTCTNGKSLYGTGASNNELFVNCHSQLVINGAFIAKSVKFLRTNNSLRDSILNEVPSGSPSSKAAEVFNFSPEIYLYTSGGDSSNDEGALPYNYITTLPPIL